MSLVPARYNFTIYQGATFYKRIFFEVEGVLQNLTEYKALFEIKDEPSGKLLMKLEDGSGITLGEKGTIDLNISSEVTSTLTWSSGVYELFLTNTTGRVDVLMRGGFKVVPF